MLARARGEGLRCEGVISTSFGCPYEGHVPPERVFEIAGRLQAAGAAGDRLRRHHRHGQPRPGARLLPGRPRRARRSVELTAHFHNTRGQGLANVLAALEAGVESFESSFGELGGCPVPPGATGNIATEDLVSMLHEMGIETGIELDRAGRRGARGAGGARPPARLPRADGRAGRVALGVFSLPGGERRVGRREGDRVIDLGPGASIFDAGQEGADHPLEEVTLHLPFAVADYADFYSSLHHASNVGRMFRPDDDPLPPNWRHLPIGYHGRAGTVVPSGTPIARPHGQRGPGDFGPTPAPRRRARARLRDRHAERRPRRRSTGRSTTSSASCCSTTGARATSRRGSTARSARSSPSRSRPRSATGSRRSPTLPRTAREPQDPPPLPYLREEPWAFDIPLELELNGTTIARTNADQLYWSVAQQIAHLTSNGATLRAGDLLGSGTISGPEKHQRGCLLELSWNGEEPIALDDGSTRTFLEDGDEAVLRGAGLGEVRGRVSGR